MLKRRSYGNFSLILPGEWQDFTDRSTATPEPLTFGKPNGVGALQFTVAVYLRGATVVLSAHDLHEMLRAFVRPHVRGPELNTCLESAPLFLAAASFALDEQDFLRAWFVTDGLSFAQVTYICTHDNIGGELVECEKIVRSIRFSGGAA